MNIFELIEEITMESIDIDKTFSKIEKASGISLPEDLKEYLRDYRKNFNDSKYDGVEILPLDESNKNYNIFNEIKYHKEENGVNFIPIEAVGNGDYIGVMVDGKIGVYNHENHKIDKLADTWTKYREYIEKE